MRDNNRILLVFILLYIFFLIIGNAYLFIKVGEISSGLTAKASGEITLCANHIPLINYSCSSTALEDEDYECIVGYIDPDNEEVGFDSAFVTSPTLFLITYDGEIEFTPNQTHIGNHTFLISVFDYSGCSNSISTSSYSIKVINVNDPPILIQPIPNQTWNQGTSLTAFDLVSYFWDPDGDPLNYTSTLLSNIQIDISVDNVVTFTPIGIWSGTEYITFFAWDPFYANASSNRVELRVIPTTPPPREPESSA